MSDSNRINRKFERLLFRGVPEKPESNYEREFHSQVDDRLSGKSQLRNCDCGSNTDDLIKIANISYFIDSEVVCIESLL